MLCEGTEDDTIAVVIEGQTRQETNRDLEAVRALVSTNMLSPALTMKQHQDPTGVTAISMAS